MVPSTNSPERQPSHKATLHCLQCGHESRINGDWIIEIHANSLDYECPECGTTIDSRQDGSKLSTQSHGSLQSNQAD